MPNLAYFEVPADDLKRAKKFYKDLLGWEFAKNQNPEVAMEYWEITTGPAEEGEINKEECIRSRARCHTA